MIDADLELTILEELGERSVEYAELDRGPARAERLRKQVGGSEGSFGHRQEGIDARISARRKERSQGGATRRGRHAQPDLARGLLALLLIRAKEEGAFADAGPRSSRENGSCLMAYDRAALSRDRAPAHW